jgi:hypothetical protein
MTAPYNKPQNITFQTQPGQTEYIYFIIFFSLRIQKEYLTENSSHYLDGYVQKWYSKLELSMWLSIIS